MAKSGCKGKQFYPTVLPILLHKEKCLQNCMFVTFATIPAVAILPILRLDQIKIIQTINADKGGRPVALAMDGQNFLSKMYYTSINPAKHKKSWHQNLASVNQW